MSSLVIEVNDIEMRLYLQWKVDREPAKHARGVSLGYYT